MRPRQDSRIFSNEHKSIREDLAGAAPLAQGRAHGARYARPLRLQATSVSRGHTRQQLARIDALLVAEHAKPKREA